MNQTFLDQIDLRPFLTLRRHLAIAHHIPGRIRLRLKGAALLQAGSIDTGALEQLLSAIDGIGEIRLNAAAGSVVIGYRIKRIPPETWGKLLQGPDEEALETLRGLLAAAGKDQARRDG